MEPAPDNGTPTAIPARLFTQRKRVVLLNAIKQGQTIRAACARASVHSSTFYDYLNNDADFQQQVERARGEAEARLVEAITNGAHTGETITTPGGTVKVMPGDWRAAAWLLEHHPHTRERYAAINKSQIGGDPDNPVPVPVDVTGGPEMTTVERMAAVVTVLQRAGVMPIPEPGEPRLLNGPPEPTEDTESGERP